MKYETLEDALRKFHGLPPYHDIMNPCRGDGYFAASIRERWSKAAINEALVKLGERKWYPDER